MGTNYYVKSEKCEHCGHGDDLHIGKSSAGWCFALRVYPDMGINNLLDWEKYLRGKTIENEYGDTVSLDDLVMIITDRYHPRGLLRHELGSFCIGHGDGTYDLVVGEFS